MLNFDRIQALAEQFPGAEVSTSYGTPAIKVGKKLVLRLHQKEDAVVMMLDTVDEQRALIEADPMSFYITDHYEGYAAVLVRPTVEEAQFLELLERSWKRVARKKEIEAYEAGR